MRRTGKPPLLSGRDRPGRAVQVGPGLHFDKYDRVSAPGDQVYLSAIAAVTARKDAIALQNQEHRSGVFRPMAQAESGATLIGGPTWTAATGSRIPHCFFNSTARA